jgi:hypothetical protein
VKEWFYAKVDFEHRDDFKSMLMSPLRTSFGLKRPKCDMGEAAEKRYKIFNMVVERIGSRGLILEVIASISFPPELGGSC